MLKRSFKPAKCKTALKLAASRIKLLKNKRAAQVKQLKRELAQLLESGQDQTARIRVEHVVREEKTMAAYDLLEIYCELIVARLPIIESQKNCPIDLKEAISSVIFASPRCADVPELMDVRKHFTAKYGKEFVTTAVELRPDCGVSRLLVEKLSAKAPDGPTKVKILSAIAEEHNIKWDPESFGEKDSKPFEDLLNGPNTFEKASKMTMDPSNVDAIHSHYEKGPSNVDVRSKNNEKHDVPVNVHKYNATSSPHSEMDSGGDKEKWSGAFHPESRPTGSGNGGMEFRHIYTGNGNAFSSGGQNWNMEFKDATAAAQAAAESAERASMAARAAAELSSRGHTTWQYSAESHRDEEHQKLSDSTLQNEHHAKGPVGNVLHRRNSKTNYEQIDSGKQDGVTGIAEKFYRDDFKSINKSSRSTSLKSGKDFDDKPLVNNLEMTDGYSRNNSSKIDQSDLLGQVSLEKQSSNNEVESMNKLQHGVDFKSVDDFEEVKFRKQPSRASSHSHSSTFSDYHEVVSSTGGDADENPFAVNDKDISRRNSDKTSSYENAAVVFDDYGLDEDECEIDIKGEHKGDEYSLNFSSPSRKSPTHLFANTNAWSDRENIDESQGESISQSHVSMERQADPVFSESTLSSTVPSQADTMLSATFDDSDGPGSESEEELDKSKLVRNTAKSRHTVYSRTSEVTQDESHGLMDSALADKGDVGSSQPWLKPSTFDVKLVESYSDRNQGISVNAGSARKFGYDDVSTYQSSPRFRTSKLDFNDIDDDSYNHSFEGMQRPSRFSMGHGVKDNVLTSQLVKPMEDIEPSEESSLESSKELNFDTLTGGLRNKGYKRPPFILSPSGNALSSNQTARDTSINIKESLSASFKASVNPEATNQDPLNREVSAEVEKIQTGLHFGSRDGDSYDEVPQHTSTSSKGRYDKKAGTEDNITSGSRIQYRYLDSTDSDSECDIPSQALTSKARLSTGLSRRTKASPSNTVISEASVTPGHAEERNFPSRNLYSIETRQKSPSQKKSSGHLSSSDRPRLAEQAAYKSIPEPERSSNGESLKSSAKEQTSKSLRKKATSGGTESLKTSSSSVESPSKENASHVHRKLPDYEAFTAHLQSLRQNR